MGRPNRVNRRATMRNEIVFIDFPATVSLDGGIVRFNLASGGETIRCAMSPSNFLQSFGNAAEVAHECILPERGGAEIIPFPRAAH